MPNLLHAVLGSARFTHTLVFLIFCTAFSTYMLRSLMGWAGLIAVLLGLAALAAGTLVVRRDHIDWHGSIPLSLAIFVGWTTLSVVWSNATFISAGRIGYFLVFGFLGFFVATTRDTIQIVRSVGDALRVLLVLSLVIEITSGLLIDMPIPFLNIEGNIAEFGPIQGIFGSRNQLGFVSLLALITFATEMATRSVPRTLSRASLLVAATALLLSKSPVVILVVAVVAIAAVALLGIRRVDASTRWRWQLGILATLAIGGLLAWLFRNRVIDVLNAGSEFEARLNLWNVLERFEAPNPLLGWGFTGFWPSAPPYDWVSTLTHRQQSTGLSAYVDVWFQLGQIGVATFVVVLGLAFVRAWLLASTKRSVVYVWPALVLVALATVAFAESTILFEVSWMLLVACAIKSSRSMSWREALHAQSSPATRRP